MGLWILNRDIEVIADICRFGGLTLKSISKKHFNNNIGYASERMAKLYDKEYVSRRYYYAKNVDHKKSYTQRISSIYYPLQKGLNLIGSDVDVRTVKPVSSKLDVTNLISNLYIDIPELLPSRQTRKRYELENFMPVTCSVRCDNKRLFLIHIIGKRKGYNEIAKILSFIKSGILHSRDSKNFEGFSFKNIDLRHIIVSRNFDKDYIVPGSNFISWSSILEILPNIVIDENYYLTEFLSILKEKYSSLRVVGKKDGYTIAQSTDRTFHVCELFSGSADLKLLLRRPPKNTLIYLPTYHQLYNLPLLSGSATIYSKDNNRYYSIKPEAGALA